MINDAFGVTRTLRAAAAPSLHAAHAAAPAAAVKHRAAATNASVDRGHT